jgi:hypothetical protein
MKCREARQAIAQRGVMTSPVANELSVHLRVCPGCAAIARSDRLTRLLLEALAPDEQPSPDFFARLRARLREVAPPASGSPFWVKALVPTLASLTLMVASIAYLLPPPASSAVSFHFLHPGAVTPETFAVLGIPPPTRDQVLLSVLGVEEQVP